jgi:CBS domain-containing protein
MTVSEIMTAGVQTVRPGTPAVNARHRMRTKQIHHLLVKEGAELVGVLSARDLGRGARRGGTAKRVLVADFMTPGVVTVEPDTSVHRAANMMRGQSIGSLIVVDKGRAVGIVTVADLLDQIGRSRRHRIDRQTPPDLHYRVPHRKQHRAGGPW